MGDITEFLIQLYFSQIYAGVKNKMYSKSLSLAITIAEITDNHNELKILRDVYNNTTSAMQIPLPILEDLAEKSYKSLKTRKMQTYVIYGKHVKFHQIIKALSDAYIRITICVTRIAKTLNIDIPFDMSKYPVQQEQ
jgi:hypothetical protein